MSSLQDVCATSIQSKPRSYWLKALIKGFCASLERARTRQLLAQLDDRQLSDLGISHADRIHELDKPSWR
ncbi:DUF1127 domain-containing protein [Pseudomonas sp. NFX15]|uniref:DUF1127 domain-containing protein n=1 Tax=Pseudomonas sp. NFX15 TaxID=2816958 RepID=UPI003B8CA728